MKKDNNKREMTISMQDVYEAYRKLKNYFYYDNTSLTIRYKIADFERQFYVEDRSSFKDKFSKAMSGVLSIVNDEDKDGILMEDLLGQISFNYITKSVDNPQNENEKGLLVTNRSTDSSINVSKLNMLIDAPIEIHIISMLWLIYVGKHFGKLLEKNNYAYLFDYDDENDDLHHGLQLFKPYYRGYQKWRDTALTTATWLLDEGKDASILCLDIKRYYYTVRLNVLNLLNDVCQKNEIGINMEDSLVIRLCQLVQKINSCYTQKTWSFLEEDMRMTEEEVKAGISILPVGLLSSSVLANLYLHDFDNEIIEKLNPVYYGRYVDDMLFVFSDRKIESTNSISSFMEYFVSKNILSYSTDDKSYLLTEKYSTLKVQGEKIVLQHFLHNESRAAINKFRKNIEKQRSEFRFLPDEENLDEEFDNDAFSLQYSDSIQKLRSLQGFREDKFGASKFLASKIFMACMVKDSDDSKESKKRTSQQILNFFKGRICVDFCTLWEKVATYFFITENTSSLKQFIKQAITAINSIQAYNIPEHWVERYKNDLQEFLILSVATPYALNPEFKVKGFSDGLDVKLKNKAQHLRFANMFRHDLLGIRGINYTEKLFEKETNLFKRDIPLGNIDQDVLPFLSPRYFRYDEANLLSIFLHLGIEKSLNAVDLQKKIVDSTNNLFKLINYHWYGLFSGTEVQPDPTPIPEKGPEKVWLVDIDDQYWDGKVNKRIAIANMKVDDKQVERSMLKKADLSIDRRKILYSIINQAAKEKCEILILPELSVPHQWLDVLVGQSKKHHMAIIAGIEYYHGSKGYVYNGVATILPFSMRHVCTAATNLRIKNYYSPLEKKYLEGFRYKIPEFATPLYCLFHWHKVYFSVYNCFELANISDRSLFKSKVDFIVATELNRDVNYYADIAGSWVRDIHCYFIQVNTSHYGDSCIMQPTKTEKCKMVYVKGGKNSTILVEDLNISNLRSFQFKEHITQMDDHTFKLTPPDFYKENVGNRIENEKLESFKWTLENNEN